MKTHEFRLAPIKFYAVLLAAVGLTALHLAHTLIGLTAFSAFQRFVSLKMEKTGGAMTARQHDAAQTAMLTALRREPDNAEWWHEWGLYLHWVMAETQDAELLARRDAGLQEAEAALRRAAAGDPANAWIYYEAARLTFSRGESCEFLSDGDAPPECATERYFFHALRLAPNRLFLRMAVAVWLASYAPDKAARLVQEVTPPDHAGLRELFAHLWGMTQSVTMMQRLLPNTPEMAKELSWFLYDQRRDYESDLAARPAASPNEADICPQADLLRERDSSAEFGSDDGYAEWGVSLVPETVRVKKVICLPPNLAEYRAAAVKILMNTGGSGNFTATVSLDNAVIRQYDPANPAPRLLDWQEIPFDIRLLEGKSRVTVYVRAEGVSPNANFLHIRGDSSTNLGRSAFKLYTQDDLSYSPGVQAGEYMIRLVLTK